MKNRVENLNKNRDEERIAYVYLIKHKRLDVFKVGKSINIVKRVYFMSISEFDVDSCIALELKSESEARKLESNFKRDLKQFNIPIKEASHYLRTSTGHSEWFLDVAWSSLEERINRFSLSYEFIRVSVDFPKITFTPRAKSIYEAECIWTKRWYKRNKDLEGSSHFHNTLKQVTEQSEMINVWYINQHQFNISFKAYDELADAMWWQEIVTNLHAQSHSSLVEKYFMHQAVSCFENTIVITFNCCLVERSAFEVQNPYDLILEKLFAEALAKFRLIPREILH
jgi:Fe2+ transport system protein B